MPSPFAKASFLPRAAMAAFLAAAATSSQADEPVIRVNTHLVEVDVVVRGKTGPITGLKAEDFTVTDGGKAQAVAAFHVRSPDNRPVNAAQLPDGVVSNRLANREEEDSGVTVLLVDRVNTSDRYQAEVRRELLRYLESAPKGERLAVYSMTKTLRIVQDFTDDPMLLRKKVLNNASPESSLDLTAELFGEDLSSTGDALADSLTQNSADEMKDSAVERRVDTTVHILELIAKHLEGLGGRKKLLWFGSSFPARYSYQSTRNGSQALEVHEFSAQIDKAAKALNRANVAVYPVDPRNPIDGGLSADGVDTMNLLASKGGFAASGIDTMTRFASKTGGRAFYDITDLEAAIQAVEKDDQLTYVLGFYPEQGNLDGKFHPISVKVARPGVEVRYRKGYFASDSKTPNEKQRFSTLLEVFGNPLETTGIGLIGRATEAAGRSGYYNLDLKLNLSELHLEREKDRWVALISVATEFPPLPHRNGTLENIKLSLTEARLRETLATGYPLQRSFYAGPLTGDLRVVVQDRVTGDAGSVRLRIGSEKDGQ